MKELLLNIATDNAAFEEDGGRHELARILRAIADNVEMNVTPGAYPVRDVNGNKVGSYQITGDG